MGEVDDDVGPLRRSHHEVLVQDVPEGYLSAVRLIVDIDGIRLGFWPRTLDR